jgi:hypothetical protein
LCLCCALSFGLVVLFSVLLSCSWLTYSILAGRRWAQACDFYTKTMMADLKKISEDTVKSEGDRSVEALAYIAKIPCMCRWQVWREHAHRNTAQMRTYMHVCMPYTVLRSMHVQILAPVFLPLTVVCTSLVADACLPPQRAWKRAIRPCIVAEFENFVLVYLSTRLHTCVRT